MIDPPSAELEKIELERVRLLVAADVEAAAALHADDFQLITPSGNALSKTVYLDSVATGDIDYTRWEPGPIESRLHGDIAVLRYQAEMEMGGTVRQLWHTDLYERRDGRWLVVWSQATSIASGSHPVNLTGMDLEPAATVAAVIDVWNGAPVDRLDALLASDYRGHMLNVSDGERDAPAYPVAIERYRAANPGTTFSIVEKLASDARLVTRLEARRVDKTSRAASVSRGINISRFDDQGRLAEEWAIWSAWLDESQDDPYR